MVAEGRGGGKETGLGGHFNQLLVKTMAAAECMTALTRVSGGPSAFLFCVTRGGRQGGLLSSSRQPRSRAWFPVGHINANLPVMTHEVCWHEGRTQTKEDKKRILCGYGGWSRWKVWWLYMWPSMYLIPWRTWILLRIVCSSELLWEGWRFMGGGLAEEMGSSQQQLALSWSIFYPFIKLVAHDNLFLPLLVCVT